MCPRSSTEKVEIIPLQTRVNHHRKIIITEKDMLRSPLLERLADRLLSLQNDSGLTKPEFAAFLGISGSQFRYLRRRLTNPSIHSLAHISTQVKIPLYQLLENTPLGNRKRLSGEQMSACFGKTVSRFLRRERPKEAGLRR